MKTEFVQELLKYKMEVKLSLFEKKDDENNKKKKFPICDENSNQLSFVVNAEMCYDIAGLLTNPERKYLKSVTYKKLKKLKDFYNENFALFLQGFKYSSTTDRLEEQLEAIMKFFKIPEIPNEKDTLEITFEAQTNYESQRELNDCKENFSIVSNIMGIFEATSKIKQIPIGNIYAAIEIGFAE